MAPVQPEIPEENDERLRRALERLDGAERRLDALERQVNATTPSGWACAVCERGWVAAHGDVLACNRCGFRRHL